MRNNRRGENALRSVIRRAFAGKQNKQELISAMAGARNAVGEKEITIPGHPDFIWARIRGQRSEVVRAFNEVVGLNYGMPILLARDEIDPRYYRVVRRDTGKYQDWGNYDGGNFTIKPHGRQHSFGDPTVSGNDPTFVYKRQIVQPLLCRPQSTPDMTVYVEADFYFWNNQFLYWEGGSSDSLAAYVPSDSALARYVTIFFDAPNAEVAMVAGDEFIPAFSNAVDYIPEIDPSQGFPLAAVLLTSSTASITWADVFDLRIMLSSTFGNLPGPHGLDPSEGFHTGQLYGENVYIQDPHSVFASTDLEEVLYELYLDAANGGASVLRVWFGG